jgi:arginine utilization protein RocB
MDKQQAIARYIRIINQNSVSETEGEAKFGAFLEEELNKIAYFNQHPENILLQPVSLGGGIGHNVFALLEAKKPTSKTVILLSHYDTVGIEEYGAEASLAFDPITFTEHLKSHPDKLNEQARIDLMSGDYLFGRGCADMKWGLNAGIEAMCHFAEKWDELNVNLLLLSTPDEEVDSRGMREAVKQLDVYAKQGYRFVACLVSEPDIASDRHENTMRIHTGCAGKLLPAVLVRGKETHVGEPFSGVNPNSIISQIVNQMELIPDFSDQIKSAFTPAPVCLKQTDLKTSYTVQSPLYAYAYFNVMTLTSTPLDVMDKFVEVIKKAAYEVMEDRRLKHQAMETKCGKTIHWSNPEIEILTKFDPIEDLGNNSSELDLRTKCVMDVVGHMDSFQSDKILISAFLLPPYYPHNISNADHPLIRRVTERFLNETKKIFLIDPVYQGLTDMSYLGIEKDIDLDVLRSVFPSYKKRYDLPLEEMAKLNIPFLNLGPLGKDAHQYGERIDMDYSFNHALSYFIGIIDLIGEEA